MNPGDEIILQEVLLMLHTIQNAFADLFLSPDVIAVVSVIGLASLAFWLKSGVKS
jgi:hypothetical protein